MAYVINAGDLRTPCVVERQITTYDASADPVIEWVSVFDAGRFFWCAIDLKAEERDEDGNRIVVETAEITARFSPKIDETCRIITKSEPEKPFMVESAVPMRNRQGWMVITAKRRGAAR